MPKKTRKEKIIAELRRKLASQETILQKRPQRQLERPQITTDIESSLADKKGEISILNYDYSYVVSDLKKTLYISTLAISLELVLYYILELGGGNKIAPIISKFVKIL